jgi:hypothetical protein
MYKCEYFVIQELVSRAVYAARKEKAWQLFDDRILRVADILREYFGPATVNNWHIGGDFQFSGLRVYGDPYFSQFSQHSFGRALDIKFSNATAEEVRQWIKYNAVMFSDMNISVTLEDGVTWVHIDVRNSSTPVSSFNP